MALVHCDVIIIVVKPDSIRTPSIDLTRYSEILNWICNRTYYVIRIQKPIVLKA